MKNLNNLNNNTYKLDNFLKHRNNLGYNSKKSVLYKNTFIGSRNNNKINKKIDDLKKEIKSDKNYFDFKIFDYKNKNQFQKNSNLTSLTNKKNKSFEYRKNLFSDNYNNDSFKNFKTNKKSNILYFRNTNTNLYNNFKTINNIFNNNNNLILNQNNTNNYFYINYNYFKKENPKTSFLNFDNNKESEENSIDINNIDNSSILYN